MSLNAVGPPFSRRSLGQRSWALARTAITSWSAHHATAKERTAKRRLIESRRRAVPFGRSTAGTSMRAPPYLHQRARDLVPLVRAHRHDTLASRPGALTRAAIWSEYLRGRQALTERSPEWAVRLMTGVARSAS